MDLFQSTQGLPLEAKGTVSSRGAVGLFDLQFLLLGFETTNLIRQTGGLQV